jgi:hypothetical protein
VVTSPPYSGVGSSETSSECVEVSLSVGSSIWPITAPKSEAKEDASSSPNIV